MRTVGLVAGQARALKVTLEHRIGIKVPSDARILYMPAKPGFRECLSGMLNMSSEAGVVTEQGMAIKTRAEHQESSRVVRQRALQWSPDRSDRAFDLQVSLERPAESPPRSPNEALVENKVAMAFLRRAVFERWCLSGGCPGCRYLRTGQGRQQAHSEVKGVVRGL